MAKITNAASATQAVARPAEEPFSFMTYEHCLRLGCLSQTSRVPGEYFVDTGAVATVARSWTGAGGGGGGVACGLFVSCVDCADPAAPSRLISPAAIRMRTARFGIARPPPSFNQGYYGA